MLLETKERYAVTHEQLDRVRNTAIEAKTEIAELRGEYKTLHETFVKSFGEMKEIVSELVEDKKRYHTTIKVAIWVFGCMITFLILFYTAFVSGAYDRVSKDIIDIVKTVKEVKKDAHI